VNIKLQYDTSRKTIVLIPAARRTLNLTLVDIFFCNIPGRTEQHYEICQKIWQVTGPRSEYRTSQIKTGIIPTKFWCLMANNESITKPTDLVGMQAKCFVIGLKICGG
jgi:hypothetical protein